MTQGNRIIKCLLLKIADNAEPLLNDRSLIEKPKKLLYNRRKKV